MRTIKLFKLGAAIALAASAVASLAAGPDTFSNGRSFYGSQGGETADTRAVDLGALKYINVKYGETITFHSEGKRFTWTFNGLDQLAVELSKIAPPGYAARPLTIYVAQDPSVRN